MEVAACRLRACPRPACDNRPAHNLARTAGKEMNLHAMFSNDAGSDDARRPAACGSSSRLLSLITRDSIVKLVQSEVNIGFGMKGNY